MAKPLIETIINTTALGLTSYGTLQITTSNKDFGQLSIGLICIATGMFLEFLKYWGRKYKYW